MSSLIGQYYCYGDPMPPSVSYLKRVLLYYDKIVVPDYPFYVNQYSRILNEKALQDWMEPFYVFYFSDLQKWQDVGLVSFAKTNLSKEQTTLLSESNSLDLEDPKYLSLITKRKYLLTKKKFPYKIGFEGNVQRKITYDIGFEFDAQMLKKNLREQVKSNMELDYDFIENQFARRSTVESLNFALLGAWSDNSIPTTDNPFAEQLLNYKLKRAVKYSEDPTMTLSTILELTVPHFDTLPMEQFLKIRDQHHDALLNFRKEVVRINRIVQHRDRDSKRDIQEIVETEIYPQLAEIRKIQLDLQPKVKLDKMILKMLFGRIPYVDLLLEPVEAIRLYRKQRELKRYSFYLLSLL